jgi:integrase
MTPRGDGRVFRRGSRYWIAYYGIVNGRSREIRESAGATDEAARKKLAKRLREVEAHRQGERQFVGPAAQKLTIRHLVGSYLEDAEMRRLRSLRSLEVHAKSLLAGLGHFRATHLTSDEIRRFVAARRRAGRADATIDRELEILRAALKLAHRAGRLAFLPHVPTVSRPRANVRTGFVSPEEFARLLSRVEDQDFADYLEWFWWTAMRPSEIAALRWESLDETTQTLRLEAADAKIGRARLVPIAGPLVPIIERRKACRVVGLPLIFHAAGSSCRQPRRAGVIERWYDQWAKALLSAGLQPSLLIYDLRRSAIRNLRLAGVPERTAMAISGHVTRSTFDRYSIQTPEDIADALRSVEGYVRAVERGQVADKSRRG